MARWLIGSVIAFAAFMALVAGGTLIWTFGYDAGVREQKRVQCRDTPERQGVTTGKIPTLWGQPASGGRCTGREGAA